MGDMGEMWEDEREAQKQRREKRLPIRTAEILSLRELGYTVEPKSEYQFRVNGTIDLYPIHNRYHNLKTKFRGGYKNAKEFILKVLPL